MKKIKRNLLIVCCASMLLCVSAFAYTVYVSADYQAVSRGVIAKATTETNTDWGLTELCAQVEILDEDNNSYAFNTATKENPTVSSVSVSAPAYDGTLDTGTRYEVQAYGHIKYMTKYGEVKDYQADEAWFTYNGARSANAVSEVASSEISQATTLTDDFQELRANYILEKFDVAPEYVYVDKIEVMDIASAAAYAMMRETMAAPPGSSMPAFFVNENQDTLLAVYEDINAVDFLFEFSKEADSENWYVTDSHSVQDIGRYQDEVQSFREYVAANCEVK